MKDDLPSPTPEGQLIRRVRDLAIPKLTIRAAAARIGISAEQWGYVERGYYPSRGGKPPQPFSPPAATLARMAHALKITPDQLESEGQRPDAADILREILRKQGGGAAPEAGPRRLPRATREMAAAMADHVAEFEDLTEAARTAHPGERLTGAMVFPPDVDMPAALRANAIWYWDQMARKWAEDRLPAMVAGAVTLDEMKAMMRDEQAATAQEKGFASG